MAKYPIYWYINEHIEPTCLWLYFTLRVFHPYHAILDVLNFYSKGVFY